MTENDPRKALGSALGRVPSGVFVVTAQHGEASTGMLASWVQQAGFEPPCLSVVIKRGRPILSWLPVGACLTLNILDETQTDMVAHFGKGFRLEEPAFTGVEIEPLPNSGPVLKEALAYLLGRVLSVHAVADQELLLVEVLAGQLLGEGKPMVHIRKSGFHY